MKRKTCAVLTSLLVMALLVASAVGGGCKKEPASDLTVENVAARTAQAALNLKSYAFDLEMAMHMAGVMEGEAGDMTVSLKGDGAVDLKDREMGMELAMSIKGKAGDETLDETMEIATYIVGDMAYQGTADEEGEMQWQSQAVPSGTWNQMQVEQQIKVLEKSKVKLLKAEKVGSIQCYVVEMEPDLATLWETVMQQPAMGGFSVPAEKLKDVIKKLTVKQWFVKDTLFLKKAYMSMEMVLTPEALGEEGEGEITMTIEMTMGTDRHNQAIEVKVPAEAKAGG